MQRTIGLMHAALLMLSQMQPLSCEGLRQKGRVLDSDRCSPKIYTAGSGCLDAVPETFWVLTSLEGSEGPCQGHVKKMKKTLLK